MKKISQLFHTHLTLNKYKILNEIKKSIEDGDHDIIGLTQHGFMNYTYMMDNYLNIYYYDTGEEFTIPNNLLIALSSMHLNDYYSSHYIRDENDLGKFLSVLQTLSNHYTDWKFMKDDFRWVFKVTFDELDDFKSIRDDMYNELDGCIVGYISYSSPNEYKFI